MKNSGPFLALICIIVLFSSCTVVRPGEIGLRQTLGKLHAKEMATGAFLFNPFVTAIIKINSRTVENYNQLPLPTKDGLSVDAQISLLYHVDPTKAKDVYLKFGRNYEEVIVLSNFRATAREVSSRFNARDLYATERQKVEEVIAEELKQDIGHLGFVIDAVLLKDIILPAQLSQSIQDKLSAEQTALKMDYIIQQQEKEADRRRIEAQGIKDAQDILNSSLSDKVIQYNYIEMMRVLASSPNSKIIVLDSRSPLNLNGGLIDPSEVKSFPQAPKK